MYLVLDKRPKSTLSNASSKSSAISTMQKPVKGRLTTDLSIDKKILAAEKKRSECLQNQLKWNAKVAEVLSIVHKCEVARTEKGFNCLKNNNH